MRLVVLGSLLIAGLAAGFGGALLFLRQLDRRTPEVLDLTFPLKAEAPWMVTLLSGWGSTSVRGTALGATAARMTLPLPQTIGRDLILDLEVWADAAAKPVQLTIEGNGVGLGAVRVSGPGLQRVFLPAEVAKKKQPFELRFIPGGNAEGVILETISLREAARLSNFSGHVDNCSGAAVIGWAMADDLPAPITVKRKGKPDQSRMPSIPRPDVKKGSRPRDVGFSVAMSPAIAPGERIEVVFPDGRPVPGSPCGS